MDETQLPTNSHRAKTDKPAAPSPEVDKKIEKVIDGDAVRRKKPMGRRFMETFFGGSDAKSIVGYVIAEVLIPAAKDTIADMFSQGIERALFGDVRSSSRRTGSRPGASGYTNYNRFSSSTPSRYSRQEEPARQMTQRGRASHDFDEIILRTRAEAGMVLERLSDLVGKYGSASVADLYELVGQTASYTDDKWGWLNVRDADMRRVRDGYILVLPPTEPLD